MKNPSVYFYMSPELMSTDIEGFVSRKDYHRKPSGVFNWTLQAYVGLRSIGFECQLVSQMPAEGIVLAHKDCLSAVLRPSPKRLVVCIKPDRSPYPFAQAHIVQNHKDDIYQAQLFYSKIYFVHHFPQPNLIARDPSRGTRVKNVAYIGSLEELDAAFKTPEWKETLAAIGVNWIVKKRIEWNDLSDVDVLFAVRRLKGNRHLRKPASKLVNAWRAGVPAVLGLESASRYLRRSEADYLEVKYFNEAFECVSRLKTDPLLYTAMVDHGKNRAGEFTEARVIRDWKELIENQLYLDYERWMKVSWLSRWARFLVGSAIWGATFLKNFIHNAQHPA